MDVQVRASRVGRIRAQLGRILSSEDFDASERNRRFLEYVVGETLAGRAVRIKAYSIATAVFGRDESFDAQVDPIVRIEARRLRRALEHYYLTSGAEDPVRITIPTGAYVPAFEDASGRMVTEGDGSDAPATTGSVAATPRARRGSWMVRGSIGLGGLAALGLLMAWIGGLESLDGSGGAGAPVREGPAIFVAPFEAEGDQVAFPSFSRGFTRDVLARLTRFSDLMVFGPETTFRYGERADLTRILAELDVDFILTGGAHITRDQFTVEALLVNARTGQYVWASRFEESLGPSGINRARDKVATSVARILAQPYGVIFSNQARDSEDKPAAELTSYECVVRFYSYWRTFRREEYHPVKTCLEEAVSQEPGYAAAHAALALVYLDGYRFGFDGGAIDGDARAKALDLARRAVSLAPDSARGYHALSLAYWLMNDVAMSLQSAEAGLALNPNDTELMAELGMRYCWRNQWERGVPLIREAYRRNPAQPSSYRLALFLDEYLQGRYNAALVEAQQVDAPHIIYGHAAMAMGLVRLGRVGEAKAAIGRILEIDPAYGRKLVGDLEMRNVHPDLIRVIVEGLREAGLVVPGRSPAERS